MLWLEEKHFVLIKDFNSFAVSQYRLNTNSHKDIGRFDQHEKENNYPTDEVRDKLIRMHRYGRAEQLNACNKCLHVNHTIRAYIQHGKLCIDNDAIIPKMPEEGKNILKKE